MEILKPIGILLWKDLIYRRNHFIRTLCEIILPIGLIIFLKLQVNINSERSDIYHVMPPLVMKGVTNDCNVTQDHYKIIMYEPSNPFLKNLMESAGCIAGYKTSSVKPGIIDEYDNSFEIGVKFHGINESTTNFPNSINYTVYPTKSIWNFAHMLWSETSGALFRNRHFDVTPIYKLQGAIDAAFLHMKNVSGTDIYFENTAFFEISLRPDKILFTGIIVIMYSFANVVVTSSIVQEKCSGAKELLLMMGVKRCSFWISKLIDALIPLSIVVIGIIIFMYIPLSETSFVMKQVPPQYFILAFGLGTINIICFLCFLSCCINSTFVATIVSGFLWAVVIMTQVIFESLNMSRVGAILTCLLPHFCLINNVHQLLDFEFYEKVVRFDERLSEDDDALSLCDFLSISLFDIILYSLLTWYLDRVRPGKFGIPQPYLFFLSKSYWISNRIDVISKNSDIKPQYVYEEVPEGLKAGVSVQHLSKIYKSSRRGTVIGVDDISINFYSGEISALLGRNGAGKTSTISMICGLAYPTSGRIIVNGYDVAVNPDLARRSLGLCPQKDMLFEKLSALQNIALCGMVKGLSYEKAKGEAERMLIKLKMETSKDNPASKLSGGQKRKVCLAMSLIGDNEVVVLDEPTSGMDPEIRREIWEILLEMRGLKTIILTTHLMEEADAICDRIAIMDYGQVKCFGTSMYLKSKYGTAYNLSAVLSKTDRFSNVAETIRSYVSSASLKSQNGSTVIYLLPENEVTSFPALFDALDNLRNENEIVSYSVSISTLEDVFLKVSHDENKSKGVDLVDHSSPYKRFSNTDELGTSKYSGLLLFYQIFALFEKKWTYFQRKFIFFFFFHAVVIALVALIEFLSTTELFGSDAPSSEESLPYVLDLYGHSEVLYSSDSNSRVVDAFQKLVEDSGSKTKEVENVTEAIYDLFKEDFRKYALSTFSVEFSRNATNILYNERVVHAIPISMNLVYNALLRSSLNGSISTSINIKLIDKEWRPSPVLQARCDLRRLTLLPTYLAMFYMIGPMQEKFHGMRNLQFMLVPTGIYWFTHLFFDAICLMMNMIFVVCIVFGFADFGTRNVISNNPGTIFSNILLWSLASLQLNYLITTNCRNLGTAVIFAVLLHIVGYLFSTLANLNLVPELLACIHPSNILELKLQNLCDNGKGHYTLYLVLYWLLMFVIIVAIKSFSIRKAVHGLFTRLFDVKFDLQYPKDGAVVNEERNVRNVYEGGRSKALVVDDLKRWYLRRIKPNPAVRGISFAVNHGECFGLVGVNGAGKSSTFNMLTGALVPSHGKAYVNSAPLFSCFKRDKALHDIGYCPQFAGFIPCFKGREVLRLFARLRGVRPRHVENEINKWVKRVGIEEYEEKECGTYSGGNQRKLAAAAALIGDSPLIFLDEPTTGVDPAGRRSIWSLISGLQDEGQSIVLTSHSMDECEALCTRLSIMVKGQFCCVGETTTLKETFGKGYSVLLKLSANSTDREREKLKEVMTDYFDPGCQLTDQHLTILHYHITNERVSWSQLFSRLEELKQIYAFLESYSASSTTLEEIFISFARNQ